MYLFNFIMRYFLVSTFLLSVLQCSSSAVRFSRSMRYPAAPVRKLMIPWKYIPHAAALPAGMQRRFMWNDMDETVDELMDGVTTGARAMTHMFTPKVIRYRKPIEYDPQASTKIKYVIKKPMPPFNRLKVIKFRAPKKTIPIYKNPPVDIPSSTESVFHAPSQSSIIVPTISQLELRKIEKEQEKRVELQSEEVRGIHEHSHQTHLDEGIISGRINEFGEGWLPIKAPNLPPKPFTVSKLHTKVDVAINQPLSAPKENHSYEVTEHNAEESVKKEQAFKPSNHFDSLTSTTELPNYPEYFLKNIQEQLKAKQVRTSTSAPFTTDMTITSVTLTNRLPPRSTTERPYKRYHLHRPKSSKLFFKRPTNFTESAKHIPISISTEPSRIVIQDLLPIIPEVTRETIKTTRDSMSTSTTQEPIKVFPEKVRIGELTSSMKEPSKAPPEKVRTTRNDSDVKSKLRIKNSSQNESLNKILNKHRGTVKFGAKNS